MKKRVFLDGGREAESRKINGETLRVLILSVLYSLSFFFFFFFVDFGFCWQN